jgi:hypothetical protein
MSSQDNQTLTTNTSNTANTADVAGTTESLVKNVTGYIHYNKEDDLTKMFNVLHKFRTDYGLKYSHNRDFIFFSVKSDCLGELAKVQPFRISHYRSKSTYNCTKEVSEKVLAVRDSFVRASWNDTEGCLEFLSRTIGRVHNYLVSRMFKTGGETFVRANYHFVRVSTQEAQDTGVVVQDTGVVAQDTVPPKGKTQSKGKLSFRGKKPAKSARPDRPDKEVKTTVESSDGFTKVVRNKSKYNKNKVQVESSSGPKVRKQAPVVSA